MMPVLVLVLCRLDTICARCVLCGRAASVRPPHHRPRESIWVAEAGRRLAAQQVWHRDGALWHHFSFSLTAVCGTGQYLCHSVPRSGPACHCWGCDHTEDPSGGLGGCQRVFSALLWVPQYTCFGALATLSPCVSMSLAIVFSDVLATRVSNPTSDYMQRRCCWQELNLQIRVHIGGSRTQNLSEACVRSFISRPQWSADCM